MGKKDASATKLPVDQYRKQIGKQDYKKTKSFLKATRLKAEAKKSSSGLRPCMLGECGRCDNRLSWGCPVWRTWQNTPKDKVKKENRSCGVHRRMRSWWWWRSWCLSSVCTPSST